MGRQEERGFRHRLNGKRGGFRSLSSGLPMYSWKGIHGQTRRERLSSPSQWKGRGVPLFTFSVKEWMAPSSPLIRSCTGESEERRAPIIKKVKSSTPRLFLFLAEHT